MRRVVLWLLLSACAPGGSSSNQTDSGASEASVDTVVLKRLPIQDAQNIDGLRLIDGGGTPLLLYSTETRTGGGYALEIRSIAVTDPARASRVALIPRMLPVPPQWDVRRLPDGQYETVVENAGGAVNTLMYHAGSGTAQAVSASHPLESFTRPHFVRTDVGASSNEIGAVADDKQVVLFTGRRDEPTPYVKLVNAADGVIGRGQRLWVVEKTVISGPAKHDVMPGRLAVVMFDAANRESSRTPIVDVIAFEFDAATLRDDVAVFSTGQPARVFLSSRPTQAVTLDAEDRSWLQDLSRPSVFASKTTLHLAAVAFPGTDRATVLYGAIPLEQLGR